MNNRRIRFGFLRAMLFTIAIVSSLHSPSASAAPALPVVARLHWLGLNQISADPNSATVMKIWHLPETAALERQTLDKLSGWLAGGTNAASARLRPLLDDFVTSEFNLEIRAATNAPPSGSASSSAHRDCQWLLAIHLPTDRMLFWQTNLAVAVADLTGAQALATPHGWRIRRPQSPEEIEFYRQGDWGVIGMGQRISQSLPHHYIDLDLNSQFRFRDWVDADLDFPRIAQNSTFCNGKDQHYELRSFGPLCIFQFLSLFANHCHLTVDGKNGNVSSRGTLTLVRSIEKPLPDWIVPFNYIHQPLTSFTAVRGIAPIMAKMLAANHLHLSSPPDQMFCWSKLQAGGPIVTYFAAPLATASNQLFQLTEQMENKINPWLSANGQGNLKWNTSLPGLVWSDVFIVAPFLKPIVQDQKQFVVGGLTPLLMGDTNLAPEEVRQLQASTNLIYFQAEQTDVRVDADLFLSQLFRLIFKKPQLPEKAASNLWLKKVETLVGNSVTTIVQGGSKKLVIERESTLGLTGIELQFLADWFESSTFPKGLHTFTASLNSSK